MTVDLLTFVPQPMCIGPSVFIQQVTIYKPHNFIIINIYRITTTIQLYWGQQGLKF